MVKLRWHGNQESHKKIEKVEVALPQKIEQNIRVIFFLLTFIPRFNLAKHSSLAMSGADYHNIFQDLDHADFEPPPPHLLSENDDDDEEQAWRIIGRSLSVGPRLHNLQNQSETAQTSPPIKGDNILVKDDGFHMKCYRES
ncbi:Uncharacterized protein Fot_25461 [Forsythia ovata]|uniref:Uncharacterized protein n=1 Tax=Forsythia ovata TaxID=205694 RepID=A0ABD1UA78_9LAMI